MMPTILEAAGVDPPTDLTGRSLLSAVRGEPWREWLHGEHSPCYSVDSAMQYMTDGKEKYIYFPTTGQEQLFDLLADRQELHDLAGDKSCARRLAKWRGRLTELLAARGDGFSDGKKLLQRAERYGAIVEGHPSNPP
jgi:arylsulfatase A-like enzyme